MTQDEAEKFVREYFARHGDIRSDGCAIVADVMAIKSGMSYALDGPQPATLAEAIALGDDGPTLQGTYTAENIDPLLHRAETDPVAHKSARIVAVRMLEQGSLLPPPLANFAAAAMQGAKPPEAKRGADARKNSLHKRRIILAVYLLQERGIKPTRSKATLPGNYGCDIVAGVLFLSYDAIEKIWKGRTR